MPLLNARRVLVVVYLAAVTAVIFGLLHSWSYDDPYITYRYAANLARGLGFVYNPGERVLSTTAPLFAVLLAGLRIFWQDLPSLANLIGAISLAAGGILLWDLARLWKTPLAGWVCLFLYPLFPQLVTTLGSETPLYLALILAGFHAYARKKYPWAALWCGLVVLVRPDAALAPVVLGLDYLIRVRKPAPWSALSVFFAITLTWTAFGLIYFGSPFPATLFAKQQQGVMAISQRFLPGFLALLKTYRAWEYLLQAVLALIGIIFALIRRSPWLIVIAWSVLYFLAYTILGVSRYFWYYSPLVPGFVLLAGLGVQAVWGVIKKIYSPLTPNPSPHMERGESNNLSPLPEWGEGSMLSHARGVRGERAPRFIILALPIAIIILLASAQAWNFWQSRDVRDARMAIYRQVGEYLRSNTPADATVGALEVGAIGYYSDRKMIDFAGLIQPEIAQQIKHQSTYEDTAGWAVEHFHPNYMVLFRNHFPQLEQGYGAKNCSLVQSFYGKDYGFQGDLDIYQCGSNFSK